MRSEPGVRFGIANAVLVLALLAASLVRLAPPEIAWVAVLTAGIAGAGLRWPASASLGVIAWAWFTGFVENSYGELTFAADDLRRLVLFAAAAAALAFLVHRVGLLAKETLRA